MSDPVIALGGASRETGIAHVTEVPLQGMITLRGDLSDSKITKAATAVVPVSFPDAGHGNIEGENGIAWMSPDEALILCEYKTVGISLEKMQKALGKTHALAVNVSDARASFRVAGPHARDVLAKLCPVDFSSDVFQSGMFRRTRMAQVPAAVWLSAPDTIQVICFRSQAQYVFDLLCVAAQPGSAVNA